MLINGNSKTYIKVMRPRYSPCCLLYRSDPLTQVCCYINVRGKSRGGSVAERSECWTCSSEAPSSNPVLTAI